MMVNEQAGGAVEFTGEQDPEWLALLERARKGGDDAGAALCAAYSRGLLKGVARADEEAAVLEHLGADRDVAGEDEFVHRPTRVRAVRWWRNGDHPDDGVGQEAPDLGQPGTTYTRIEGAVVGFYRHPDFPGDQVHGICGRNWHDHGWIDGLGAKRDGRVCPGGWVVTFPDGDRRPFSHVVFDRRYQRAPRWTFQSSGGDQTSPLWEAIGQAVGAASMCWENPGGAGEFLSQRAKEVADHLIGAFYAELMTLAGELADGEHQWTVMWAAGAVQQRAVDLVGEVARPLATPDQQQWRRYTPMLLPRAAHAQLAFTVAQGMNRGVSAEEISAAITAAAEKDPAGQDGLRLRFPVVTAEDLDRVSKAVEAATEGLGAFTGDETAERVRAHVVTLMEGRPVQMPGGFRLRLDRTGQDTATIADLQAAAGTGMNSALSAELAETAREVTDRHRRGQDVDLVAGGEVVATLKADPAGAAGEQEAQK